MNILASKSVNVASSLKAMRNDFLPYMDKCKFCFGSADTYCVQSTAAYCDPMHSPSDKLLCVPAENGVDSHLVLARQCSRSDKLKELSQPMIGNQIHCGRSRV